MAPDLGLSDAQFGFGAGIFFLSYVLLEIPGALIVERWSARWWMARILITWGICCILLGFIQTVNQFYLVRFLLGLAEGGFFPGIVVYLTHWFPIRERARAMAGFLVASSGSMMIGAPISAALLSRDWFGIPAWRSMFVVEGIPAVLFGFIALFYMTDRPKDADWLEADEREWLISQLEAEKQAKKAFGHFPAWQVLRHRTCSCFCPPFFFKTWD
jgi:ACS family tartrate transporter-like MFS transporter